MRSKYLSNTHTLFTLNSWNAYRNAPRRTTTTHAISEDVKPFKSIPGLSSLPLLGPLHHALPVIGEIGPKGQIFDKLGDLSAKYGSILKIPGVFNNADFVYLFEPDQFEQCDVYNHDWIPQLLHSGREPRFMLCGGLWIPKLTVYKAEETNPLRPGFQTLTYYREKLKPENFQGIYGLMTAQGDHWREFRTKGNPAMLRPKNIKLYTPGLEEIADDMVSRLSKLKDQKDYLQQNFELEITKWSLESVALVGLGTRLGCLRDDLAEDHPARKLIYCAKELMELTFKLEFMPSPWRYIATPNYKKMIQILDTQWDISSIYIHEAKKKIDARTEDIAEDKPIIEKLLAIDQRVAIMMANEMLLAGIDTVGFAFMSLLYQLAANQRVQDKLREEIRSDNSSRYLRACFKESLRIWHVIPANLRMTSKDHIVGGYHIPKGINVLVPNQYLSNHEKYYPRPKEFLPERWLADKDDPIYHGNAHPMINLPFGFGIRSCIGRRIAELEKEILLKKLLNEFKVTWEGPPMKVRSTFMNTIEKPFRIKFESAN